MYGKTAYLFAGQGSQKTGMGKDFYDEYPEFTSLFDSLKLDFDVKDICFNNPDNLLLRTQYTQPCMVAFACGITKLLRSRGIRPDYVCGLSLGEYSALYAADVWSLDDTMKIISVRGKAMAEASEGIDTSMVSITSLNPNDVEECCKKAESAGIVSVCNLNCPGQVVIGGDKSAVDIAVQYAKDAGARRCIPLSVSGPFHTAYMKPVGNKLEEVFEDITFLDSSSEVLYNFLGGPIKDGQEIKDLLVKQVQYTVRMQDCIEYLIANDVENYIEIGPGTALSGFVRKTMKAMNKDSEKYNIISINNVDDLQNLETLL